MKSAAWKFLLILACAAPLSAATWSENFNPPAKGRWMRFGKTETTSAGVRLGPAPIDWDESGMRTSFAIGNPDHRVKLALEFEGFKVDKPSMKQADEDRENGDVSVNIQLSRDSQSTFYNSKHPSVLVNLFYNAQEQKFWGCVRAKGAGVPNSSGTCIASQLIGPADVQSKVKIVTTLTGASIGVTYIVNGKAAWLWSGALPERLGDDAVLTIFQQNIRDGRGSFVLTGMNLDSDRAFAR